MRLQLEVPVSNTSQNPAILSGYITQSLHTISGIGHDRFDPHASWLSIHVIRNLVSLGRD